MLLFNLGLLGENPLFFVYLVIATSVALLVAITFHEFSHALMAKRLGDDTAERAGRVSLNPLAHLDPLGTAMLFLVGFGWGKPVPVNPLSMRSDPKVGMALVAASGAAANLVVAGAVALPIRLGVLSWHSPFALSLSSFLSLEGTLTTVIGFIVLYNLLLALFNLIPIPPLDGFNIALGLLPRALAHSFSQIAPYGPVVLMLVIGLGYFTGVNILWYALDPAISFLSLLLVGRAL